MTFGSVLSCRRAVEIFHDVEESGTVVGNDGMRRLANAESAIPEVKLETVRRTTDVLFQENRQPASVNMKCDKPHCSSH